MSTVKVTIRLTVNGLMVAECGLNGCRDCSAVRISRGNDMIIIHKGKHVYVDRHGEDFDKPDFMRRVLQEAEGFLHSS